MFFYSIRFDFLTIALAPPSSAISSEHKVHISFDKFFLTPFCAIQSLKNI